MKGSLVILSAPSGTGKSTLCRALLRKRGGDLAYSVSCTTRAPRPGEVQGKHYHFVPQDEFRRRIELGEFLEWAVVHREFYGTPRSAVEAAVRSGKDVLLAIDVQGAMAVRRRIPEAVLIFVLPPSWEALRARLATRKESRESVARRLKAAREEVRHADRYDYWVVNDRLPEAVRKIEAILAAERLRVRTRRTPGPGNRAPARSPGGPVPAPA